MNIVEEKFNKNTNSAVLSKFEENLKLLALESL
jgi:hypothetical protein